MSNNLSIQHLNLAIILIIYLGTASYANAQTAISTSIGRSHGEVVEFHAANYDMLKNIRDSINKGEYQAAAYRSIKLIRGYENDKRSGMDKSALVKETYNSLCVSSTALGKVEYAMDACNRSLQIVPNHWESLKSRATLYFLTTDYNKSLVDFKASLENSPNDAISDVLKQNISVVQSKIN